MSSSKGLVKKIVGWSHSGKADHDSSLERRPRLNRSSKMRVVRNVKKKLRRYLKSTEDQHDSHLSS